MHRWWVLLHIAGAFGFVMAHGVSAYAVLRLRKERDPVRVSQLLEMSSGSIGVMWNAIGLLLIGGVVAGFTGHFWGRGGSGRRSSSSSRSPSGCTSSRPRG